MAPQTSLDRIDQIIQEINPFESNFIIKTHHVWDDDFFDVPSINAHASDAVLEAVRKINAGHIASNTVGFRILAPKGTGKTHVLSRIRQKLFQERSGFFIYICEYGKLNRIRFQFLQGLASSLKHEDAEGIMPWQELAAALVNRVLRNPLEMKVLIQQFPKALKKDAEFVDRLTARVHRICPDIENPYLIRAILWTLSTTYAPFAIHWLSGRELTEAQAQKLGLPNLSDEDQEADAFNSIRQILNLIGYHTTPVICFDQLDGAEIDEDEESSFCGFTRAQVAGSLAMDIYNNLKRGILIFTIYEATWREQFQSLITSQALIDRINREIELVPLNPDSVVLLVSQQLAKFYQQHNLIPPHPVYPFDEAVLRKLGKQRPNVREVLQWCIENFVPGKVLNPVEEIEKLYAAHQASVHDYEDDNEHIGNALAFGFKYLIGKTINGVTIREIDREVKPRSYHKERINFRLLGQENGEEIKIGVCVVQNSNGTVVGTTIKYLTWYDQFDLTRGCLVRNKAISSHWQIASRYKTVLLDELGGEWVSFKDEELRPLLALRKVHQELENNDLTEADFQQFITEKRLIIDNPLLREILSDPAGHVPNEVMDEDAQFDALLAEDPASDDSGEADGLEILTDAALV